MSAKLRDILVRYVVASVGLFLVALGVALSVISNLGTSPLSCPAYVMSGTWGLTVGNWTIIINMLYLVVQVAVFRKNFKAKYLMQILATVVFGYMIDLSMQMFQWLQPDTLTIRLVLIVLACAVTALGVSIEVIARAWMLSAEMTVYAISKTFQKPFDKVKVVMDCSLVVISMLTAFVMYGNFFGFGEYTGIVDVLLGNTSGVVIGLGTILMAFLAGGLMRFTDPLADRMMDRIIDFMLTCKKI